MLKNVMINSSEGAVFIIDIPTSTSNKTLVEIAKQELEERFEDFNSVNFYNSVEYLSEEEKEKYLDGNPKLKHGCYVIVEFNEVEVDENKGDCSNMLKESTLKEIVKGNKLNSVITVADVKNVLGLSVDQFKVIWGLSSTASDSAPEGTTDIDLQIEYSTEDVEFPIDFCTLGININNSIMESQTNFLDWKVNSVTLYDFE